MRGGPECRFLQCLSLRSLKGTRQGAREKGAEACHKGVQRKRKNHQRRRGTFWGKTNEGKRQFVPENQEGHERKSWTIPKAKKGVGRRACAGTGALGNWKTPSGKKKKVVKRKKAREKFPGGESLGGGNCSCILEDELCGGGKYRRGKAGGETREEGLTLAIKKKGSHVYIAGQNTWKRKSTLT